MGRITRYYTMFNTEFRLRAFFRRFAQNLQSHKCDGKAGGCYGEADDEHEMRPSDVEQAPADKA